MAAKTTLHPWQLLLMCLAGWLLREQQQVIEFHQAQLEAMLQAQGKKRIILKDEQRRDGAKRGRSLSGGTERDAAYRGDGKGRSSFIEVD